FYLSAVPFDVVTRPACADDPRLQVTQLGQLEFRVTGVNGRARAELALGGETRFFRHQQTAAARQIGRLAG
ncbi:Uncharacterized protein APZ42_002754, partial [Daphnia magna]